LEEVSRRVKEEVLERQPINHANQYIKGQKGGSDYTSMGD
jgi:hypothetical protein